MSRLRRPPADLADFPRNQLRTSQPLYRIHRRDFGAWWFSHDGSGRFDLPPPRGTCYVAEDPLGSFVEAFRDTNTVAESDVEKRVLSELHVSEDVVLADRADSSALAFGVTAAIHSSEDYERTHEWAAAFADAGFAGVRYLVSRAPAQRLAGVALFGPAGAQDRLIAETGPIGRELVATARERFGIIVLPTPA